MHVQGDHSEPLVVKVALVGVVWGLGVLTDNVVEPRLVRLTPAPGEAATVTFLAAQRDYVVVEVLATALMYAALIVGATL